MNLASRRILLIEDDETLAGSLQRVLHAEGYAVTWVRQGDRGLEQAASDPFDLVLTDHRLPGMNGLELVKRLHARQPELPLLLMTAYGTSETAIGSVRSGAFDYLTKPFEMTELIEAAARALNGKDPQAEAPASAAAPSHSEPLVGAGRTMQSLFKEIGRVAATPLTVLIRGETGTGKELVARALHRHSDRADRPLVTVNCAAIPESLLESELFGHERGAFTGAAQRRIGRFEQAQHGTVFLDEIGEMSLSTQAKLLRVLQERTVQRLGSPETLPVDIRVIAATHRDLESAMEQKLFREDLFYRLNVVPLRIPPLREHPEDIPGLVEHFLQCHGPELGFASFSVQPAALPLLREQPWPGNVRQLENVVRQALLLSPSGTLTPDEVCQALKRAGPTEPGEPLSLKEWVTEFLRRGRQECWPDLRERALEALERELFTQTIDLAQGNQAEASRWLGVSRLTMREKLTRFGKRPNGQS